MNAFLVIVAVLIIGLLIAMWVVKQLNIKKKIWGIPLQYLLDTALLIVAVVAVIVIKNALGGKSRTIQALLARLNIQQTQNKINMVDDSIKEKTDAITNIDQQIKNLQPATNPADVNNLIAQQNAVKQELDDLNKQKQSHLDAQASLQQQIKDLEAL
jgi:gas vesicle protein